MLVYLVLTTTMFLIILVNRAMMTVTVEKAAFNSQVQVNIETVFKTFGVIAGETRTSRYTKTLSSYMFQNHRLRLWYGGRCIDSSDGKKLTVQFCDPDLEQVRFRWYPR